MMIFVLNRSADDTAVQFGNQEKRKRGLTLFMTSSYKLLVETLDGLAM